MSKKVFASRLIWCFFCSDPKTECVAIPKSLHPSSEQHLAEVLILFNVKTDKSNFTPAIGYLGDFIVLRFFIRPLVYDLSLEMLFNRKGRGESKRVICMWVHTRESGQAISSASQQLFWVIKYERGFLYCYRAILLSSRLLFLEICSYFYTKNATVNERQSVDAVEIEIEQ